MDWSTLLAMSASAITCRRKEIPEKLVNFYIGFAAILSITSVILGIYIIAEALLK